MQTKFTERCYPKKFSRFELVCKSLSNLLQSQSWCVRLQNPPCNHDTVGHTVHRGPGKTTGLNSVPNMFKPKLQSFFLGPPNFCLKNIVVGGVCLRLERTKPATRRPSHLSRKRTTQNMLWQMWNRFQLGKTTRINGFNSFGQVVWPRITCLPIRCDLYVQCHSEMPLLRPAQLAIDDHVAALCRAVDSPDMRVRWGATTVTGTRGATKACPTSTSRDGRWTKKI